jgi:hypothetical protein
MRLPRIAVVAALAAAVTVPASSVTAAYARPASQPSAVKSHGKHAKSVRQVFTAVGSVAAVDSGGATVTVVANAGTKGTRGRTVTIAVPAGARIRVSGKDAGLAAVQQGFRITVVGVRIGTAYTASKIEATAPRPKSRPKPAPSSSTAPPAPAPDQSTVPDESVQPSMPSEPAEDPADDPSDEPTTIG